MTHGTDASSRKPYGNKGCFSSSSSSTAVLQQQQQNLRAEPICCEQSVAEQVLAGNPGGTSGGGFLRAAARWGSSGQSARLCVKFSSFSSARQRCCPSRRSEERTFYDTVRNQGSARIKKKKIHLASLLLSEDLTEQITITENGQVKKSHKTLIPGGIFPFFRLYIELRSVVRITGHELSD